ncbi:transposase [Amaricoccus sp.]|uniref:IS66-like element accessory protein TnpA n=1 Tax=Amaricoccus sp. TaxID=1872485 RepID=UPI001B3F0C1F|nr:transposase [Amaricoccus sp.]MBP7002266.1 transposase [Amaricoccus sp.]
MVALKSGLEIEVLSAADAARRRQWSDADKLRIVEASFRGSRMASATARAHEISRSLLTTWRRQFREGTLGTVDRQPNFAPVLMAPEETSRSELVSGGERIEIVLGNGRRLIVGVGIDAAALARVVAVLERA